MSELPDIIRECAISMHTHLSKTRAEAISGKSSDDARALILAGFKCGIEQPE